MSTIGQRIREIRTTARLSQTAFGEVGGVKLRSQVNYEKDDRTPDGTYLRALHDAGYDVTYIITGYTADEIVAQRAHTDALVAAAPDIKTLLSERGVVANEWIYEGLKAIHIVDGINLGHLDMIVRGIADDQREHGIRCADAIEEQLISNYRRADERGRKVIIDTAEALSERSTPTREASGNHVQQNFHAGVDQVAGRDIVNHGRNKKK